MFYLLEVEDHVRVEPSLFGLPVEEAITQQLEEQYKNYIDKDLGAVISVLSVDNAEEGIIVPGDGAAYYKTAFKLIVFKPELNEIVFGEVSEITNFGAFINLGAVEGMMHVSQTMDDFVSFSKTNTLLGKNSKRSLKKGDLCLARIVALSYKTDEPRVGLTMRQPGLGKIEWIAEEKRKTKPREKKAEEKKKSEKQQKKNDKRDI